MACPRCNGLLIAASMEGGDDKMPCVRCLCCGWYLDEVILANQLQPTAPKRPANTPVYSADIKWKPFR